jgi:hypothetical protein
MGSSRRRSVAGRLFWKEFLTRHWELTVAADFFTVEVWTRRRLPRFIVLFFYRVVEPQGGDCGHRDSRDRRI